MAVSVILTSWNVIEPAHLHHNNLNTMHTLAKLYYKFFRHCRKNFKFTYYIKGASMLLVPRSICILMRESILSSFSKAPLDEQKYIEDRVGYYFKYKDSCPLPEDAMPVDEFTFGRRETYRHIKCNTAYFFDTYEHSRYFPKGLRWAYNPGDVNYLFPVPEITKSRPITAGGTNKVNILLNMDKCRHFMFVNDPFPWEKKQSIVLFRGASDGKKNRLDFIAKWADHPMCNLRNAESLSIFDHLNFRYIMALEGNDVASNLKWVMSSNSIAVMPTPTCETWFMEGRLIPDYHYIRIADDYHDLIDRIEYYEAHPEEAKQIVEHAHEWVNQFQNSKREQLINMMVLDRYFKSTGQIKN